jgi:hypothetical protein
MEPSVADAKKLLDKTKEGFTSISVAPDGLKRFMNFYWLILLSDI